MKYFTCTVSGKSISGSFHDFGFKEGELVEFVTAEQRGSISALAARSHSQRILWMPLYQTRGISAQKRSDLKWILILSIAAACTMQLVEMLFSDNFLDTPIFYQIMLIAGIFLIFAGVNVFARWPFLHYAKEATEILSALGIVIRKMLTYMSFTGTRKKGCVQRINHCRH